MSALFQELAYSETAIGALSLRRRKDLSLGIDIYEIKLDDDFLMSSLFTEGEVALATLGLGAHGAAAQGGRTLDVVVGGLGLGYTAAAALDHPALASLVVIDALPEVIDWHRRGLVPLGRKLADDRRCTLAQGDFFAMALARRLCPAAPSGQVDAILLDIDHSPANVLHPSHAALYTPAGLDSIAAQLRPGGVFALWSNDAPDATFTATLRGAFRSVEARVVTFDSLAGDRQDGNTIYLATTPGAA
jgi:spermidine synthase